MIHAIIVRDPAVFALIRQKTETKKVPLTHIPYEIYAHGNIRIVGWYTMSPEAILGSIKEELNPDTVFFLSESYPVSDEKRAWDIVLPNVFFEARLKTENTEHIDSLSLDSGTLQKQSNSSANRAPEWVVRSQYGEWGSGDLSSKDEFFQSSTPLFLEHYALQGDYNFETFGLSVGGIHVSGIWNTDMEDFRIRLRVVYENDTFDPELYSFVEAGKKLSMVEKVYPVAYIATEDRDATARNLWSIVGFIIGSIDADLISEEDDGNESDDEEEEWVDGSEDA